MKPCILSITFLLLIPILGFSSSKKHQIIVNEIYYTVNANGIVNKNLIIERRQFIYDSKFRFLSGKSFVGNSVLELTSDANRYYKLPLFICSNDNCEYFNGKLVKYKERVNDSQIIEHHLQYDTHNNVTKDCFADSTQIVTIRYEYFYLDSFTYAKRHGKKFVSGIKSDPANPWVIRTIKYNGKIVQYTEREISTEGL
jgi:hypothetical protein